MICKWTKRLTVILLISLLVIFQGGDSKDQSVITEDILSLDDEAHSAHRTDPSHRQLESNQRFKNISERNDVRENRIPDQILHNEIDTRLTTSQLMTIFKQIGEDIDGEGTYDKAGSGISINYDGTIIAIGSPGDNSSGDVRVFKWDASSGTWVQIGFPLDFRAPGAGSEEAGTSVSLTYDGTMLAIGARNNIEGITDTSDPYASDSGQVRVYSSSCSSDGFTCTWSQIGNDINGLENEAAGTSVSLSGTNGTWLAIGHPQYGFPMMQGKVTIYRLNNNNWDLIGELFGESDLNYFGWSVQLSANGSRLVVGGSINPGEYGMTCAGFVRVFEYQTNTWIQIGADIDGDVAYDRTGSSVSINGSGSRIIVGSPGYDSPDFSNSGGARVYEYEIVTDSWNQLGADITGESSDDSLGSSVSINANGDRIAVGAPKNDGNGSNAGHVRVFTLNTASVPPVWEQNGIDLDGECEGNFFGERVALSGDGLSLIAGGPRSGGSSLLGMVRMFEAVESFTHAPVTVKCPTVSPAPTISTFPSIYPTASPAPSQAIFSEPTTVPSEIPSFISIPSDSPSITTNPSQIPSISLLPTLAPSQIPSASPTSSIGIEKFRPVGNDVLGTIRFGNSVSTNADGTRFATSARPQDGIYYAGKVFVFEFDFLGQDWVQIGVILTDSTTSDPSDIHVELNSAGNMLIVGFIRSDGVSASARVYQEDQSGIWSQIGQDIAGGAKGFSEDIAVDISDNGLKVVVGYRNEYSESGAVTVYSYETASDWVQVGATIVGENPYELFGSSVAFNSDASRLAVGSPNTSEGGKVRVFEFNLNTYSWDQIGTDIYGENPGDKSGYSVALNSLGNIVSIGSPFNTRYAGHVRIFEYQYSSGWTQKGQDIVGEYEEDIGSSGDLSGTGLAISSDGSRVLIGAPNNREIYYGGHVRLYEYSTSTALWNQVLYDLDGENPSMLAGHSVALSDNGRQLFIGAPGTEAAGVGTVLVVENYGASSAPSLSPTHPTSEPSDKPSRIPSYIPSKLPSKYPSEIPSEFPSIIPSMEPSKGPSSSPSSLPSIQPSILPSIEPSSSPSSLPSVLPSKDPSSSPSSLPSIQPSKDPSSLPSVLPSKDPSSSPSSLPSMLPSKDPSSLPSIQPSKDPSSLPSVLPSKDPSSSPSSLPSMQPSKDPSSLPSVLPSKDPSSSPSSLPSMLPSKDPSSLPSMQPSKDPSSLPSMLPSKDPSSNPSSLPSKDPSSLPSMLPSKDPSSSPSSLPSMQPSKDPSSSPSSLPSIQPSKDPSSLPSLQPSNDPSSFPSMLPSKDPSSSPSSLPSMLPSKDPSILPSMQPSEYPSGSPSSFPSTLPSMDPSSSPSSLPSIQPSKDPSSSPSSQPSIQPSIQPSKDPSSLPSVLPSKDPSMLPSTQPSNDPSSLPSIQPSKNPSNSPSLLPSLQPSKDPSNFPSSLPSIQPSMDPSSAPSSLPSMQPSEDPSFSPSLLPSKDPSNFPSSSPSMQPSKNPSSSPSSQPSIRPSKLPSSFPSSLPSKNPSSFPSSLPSGSPSFSPSIQPTKDPSSSPSSLPTILPSPHPTQIPTSVPSSTPTNEPSGEPSVSPSLKPTSDPTHSPSKLPSSKPTKIPSFSPTITPTVIVTEGPTFEPSSDPTDIPSGSPSIAPTARPSVFPSASPTSIPSITPSNKPTTHPSPSPSFRPTNKPTLTMFPSLSPTISRAPAYTNLPSRSPSASPTGYPTTSSSPTKTPTSTPTIVPSKFPSTSPSDTPSFTPSSAPTSVPTQTPSLSPTGFPSASPSETPSAEASAAPTLSLAPSSSPTSVPSASPTADPTSEPSISPTSLPSSAPSVTPTTNPSSSPTSYPTSMPSVQPSDVPTRSPSKTPSSQPSKEPSTKPSSQPTVTPTASPSSEPSSAPSMYLYQFDGDKCRFDIECRIGRCISGFCASGRFTISSAIGYVAASTSIDINYSKKLVYGRRGGIAIETDDVLQLYGDVRNIYSFSSNIIVNKFTRLKFRMSFLDPVRGVGLCVYEQKTTTEPFITCLTVKQGNISVNTNVMIRKDEENALNGDQVNYALRMSTSQSSIYGPGNPDKAVDGNTEQYFNYENWELNTVTQSEPSLNPWWEVNFDTPAIINKIVIFKRTDEYEDDLSFSLIEVFDSNNIVVDSIRLQDDDRDLSILTLDVGQVTGVRVRITLLGEQLRVLCLAEVQVFGPLYEFDVPLGIYFSYPDDTKANRIAIIQDGSSAGSENRYLKSPVDLQEPSTLVSSILFYENSLNTRLAEYSWIQVFNRNNQNIQGDSEYSMSNNGKFFALKVGANDFMVRTLDDDTIQKTYTNTYGNLLSIAIADDGIIIAGFEDEVSASLGIVLILDVYTMDSSPPKHSEAWTAGFGHGVHITPAADMIAIGDPVENKVYTYKLNENYSFDYSSKQVIKSPDSTFSSFGWKVALSNTGESLAISCPQALFDNDKVGAIYVYVYNNNDWLLIQPVLFGDLNGASRLGYSGIALNESEGRVDLLDKTKNRYQFVYTTVCLDINSSGGGGNMFNPSCICGNGYKSSNISSEKNLINIEDICVLCDAEEDCGVAPSASPSFAPTLSHQPSAAPSLSSRPTDRPTSSTIPSGSPTTVKPTLKPTKSASPTQIPSSSPSSFNSIYDGEPCRFDIECRSFYCDEGNCRRGSFTIDAQEDDNESFFKVNAMMAIDISDADTDDGGIHVDQPTNKIFIYNTVYKIYKLSKQVEVNKFSSLKFSSQQNFAVAKVSVCLYEKIEDAVREDESKCLVAGASGGISEISIGGIVNDRNTNIQFIAFNQFNLEITELGESVVSNIRLEAGPNTDIIDENGNCKDPFSENIQNELGVTIGCMCLDGYVASNGGKEQIQERFDACVSCIQSPYCFFEGDLCSDDSECFANNCVDNICYAQILIASLEIENEPNSQLLNLSQVSSIIDLSDNVGGVVVLPELNYLGFRIYGDAKVLYKFESPVAVNKFTYLQFDIDIEQIPDLIEFCVYENESDYENDLIGTEYRCMNAPTSTQLFDVNLGPLFDFRITSIQFIMFRQGKYKLPRFAKTVIKNIRVYPGERTPIIDEEGDCSDENASITVIPGDEANKKCMCDDGFVASNGGTLLGEYDTCIRCLGEQFCALDGGVCVRNRDCLMGRCVSGVCAPRDIRVQATDIDSKVIIIRGRLVYEEPDIVGGIAVKPDHKIRLFGQVGKFYELAEPIAADRFSIMTFDLLGVGSTNPNRLSVCLLESMTDTELSCTSRCYETQSSEGALALKKTFRDRIVNIRYIGFKQGTWWKNGNMTETVLSSINVVAGIPESIFDSNGNCIDPNSRLRNLQGRMECICNDGYSASNGGNIQSVYDVCVDCHSEYHCASDRVTVGDTCARDLMITLDEGISTRPLKASITKIRKDISKSELIARGGTFVHGDNDNSITLHGDTHNTFSLVTYHIIERLSRLKFNFSILDDMIPYVGVCFLSTLEELETSNNAECICISSCTIEHPNRPPDLQYNLALGKKATQSSTRGGAEEDNANNAVDGVKTQPTTSTYKDAIFTAFETKPYWEVDLENSYRIEAVTIFKNIDTSYQELMDFNVILYDDKGDVVYYVLVNGRDSDVITVSVPHIVTSRVRITKQSDSDDSMLTFVEVEVHRSIFEATTIYEIPTGQLFPGKNIEYVTFISLSESSFSEATFSRIELLYGSSPDWSESPSVSSIPTLSVAPSRYPTDPPTHLPSSKPSKMPTAAPTLFPSMMPSNNPTFSPSVDPSATKSEPPSMPPSTNPSQAPSFTFSPSLSLIPSSLPSSFPSIEPSLSPIPTLSAGPSHQPSLYPTVSEPPSNKPTDTNMPSNEPTRLSTSKPSGGPIYFPSALPSRRLSMNPTVISSESPSTVLSDKPSDSRSPLLKNDESAT